MKRVISIAVLIISISVYSFGQDRVNNGQILFDEVSDTLKTATGWFYDYRIECWYGNPNTISMEKLKEGEALKSNKNFKYLITKTFINNGEKYYLLIVDREAVLGGTKVYDSKITGAPIVVTHNDLHTIRNVDIYVFKENEYGKLATLQVGKPEFIQVKYVVEDINFISNRFVYDHITDALMRAVSYQYPSYFSKSSIRDSEKNKPVFPILRTINDGVEVIRFSHPGRKKSFEAEGVGVMAYDSFDNAYYETPFSEFMKLTHMKPMPK